MGLGVPLIAAGIQGAGSPELESGNVRFMSPGDSFRDAVSPGGPRLGIGRYVRGMALGRWDGASDELRAMSEGTGSAGGYLVPTPLSAMVIDLARNKATVVKAGARTVPMESSTLKVARLSGDPTAAWKSENAAGSASDATLESVTFTARTLMAMVKLSVELLEDADNIEQVVSNALADALALELDRVALVGSGSAPEPQGIYGATSVQTVASGGVLTGYSKFTECVQKVYEANGEPNAIIYAPRTWGTLDGFIDGQAQPVKPPASFDALKKFTTNQVPINLGGGTDESLAFVGDFSKLWIGMRTNMTLEVSREATDTNSSAFESLQVIVRAYLRADCQLAHPAHFTVLTGIQTA